MTTGSTTTVSSPVRLPEPPFVAGRPLTEAALRWATAQHGGQRREVDCAPFILHPLEVAALLSGRGYDDEVVAAGLLHDVVEDTGAEESEVRERFGERVAGLVAAVTEDPAIEDYPARKANLRTKVSRAEPEAVAVFAADKIVKAREGGERIDQPRRAGPGPPAGALRAQPRDAARSGP